MPSLNSVTTPAGVMRPIASPEPLMGSPYSVNQKLPSGPAAIPSGPLSAVIPAPRSVIVGPGPAADAAPTSASAHAETAATLRVPVPIPRRLYSGALTGTSPVREVYEQRRGG